MDLEDIKQLAKNRANSPTKGNMSSIGRLSGGKNQYDRKLSPEDRARKAKIEDLKNKNSDQHEDTTIDVWDE